jgi:glycine cleavage system H protein
VPGRSTLRLQDHEWIKVEGDIGTIGITNHAQDQLGDVVYVDLPEVGDTVEQDETMGAVESVKAASDIYSPVSGEVTEVNEALNDDPALVNTSAEADGWMSKVKLSDPAQLDGLMDAAGYEAFCKE